jgi:hypothetical protein
MYRAVAVRSTPHQKVHWTQQATLESHALQSNARALKRQLWPGCTMLCHTTDAERGARHQRRLPSSSPAAPLHHLIIVWLSALDLPQVWRSHHRTVATPVQQTFVTEHAGSMHMCKMHQIKGITAEMQHLGAGLETACCNLPCDQISRNVRDPRPGGSGSKHVGNKVDPL